MHLDDGAVEADRFDAHADQLLMLQFLEQPIEHPGLRPAVHARVDRVPVAEALRQSAPLAAVLGHVEDRIDDLQIAERHVATLHRQEWLDASELSSGDFHAA
jgi:hypothetical protein